MKKIYIVTSGTYSDYHICAVFLTKRPADAYAALFPKGYEEATVGEYTLGVPGPIPKGMQFYHINIAEGEEDSVVQMEPEFEDYYFKVKTTVSLGGRRSFWTDCWARNKKHAIKIAREKINQYRVENNF
jgi:hypothetical protein